jgi:WD40 repeat protein
VVRSVKSVGQVTSASFTPDGSLLAGIRTDDLAADIWNTETGNLVSTLHGFETTSPVVSAAFAIDGKHLVWVARNTAQVMEAVTGSLGAQMGHEDAIVQAALSPTGSVLACASAGTVDGTLVPLVQLWEPQQGTKLGILQTAGEAIGSLAFSANGRLLAVGAGNTVTLWDVAAQQPAAALTGHNGSISALAFSPDGLTLASASADGLVRLWRALP